MLLARSGARGVPTLLAAQGGTTRTLPAAAVYGDAGDLLASLRASEFRTATRGRDAPPHAKGTSMVTCRQGLHMLAATAGSRGYAGPAG